MTQGTNRQTAVRMNNPKEETHTDAVSQMVKWVCAVRCSHDVWQSLLLWAKVWERGKSFLCLQALANHSQIRDKTSANQRPAGAVT